MYTQQLHSKGETYKIDILPKKMFKMEVSFQ
jgi:hypothetical protein